MIIPLGNKVRAEVIDSVLGQLSDGIWENSSAMDKYWKFANVDGTDLDISDESSDSEIQYGYNFRGRYKTIWNGFHGKSETEIKNWFANKAKQVVKIWAEDEGLDPKEIWNRDCTETVDYMGGHDVPNVTVADVYECYDFLKGRSGKKYATTPIEEPVEEPIEEPVVDEVIEPQVSGGMNPSQQELEDFFTGASTRIRRKGYVRASDDILAYGKCIGYGVDYRNMHTAIHGILVFSDIDEAEQAYDDLKQAERTNDEDEYNFILNNVFEFAVEDIDEINYRDFVELDGDKIYPVYSGEFIIIVNDVAVDLYL